MKDEGCYNLVDNKVKHSRIRALTQECQALFQALLILTAWACASRIPAGSAGVLGNNDAVSRLLKITSRLLPIAVFIVNGGGATLKDFSVLCWGWVGPL